MGEAKKRGSFEERRAAAIARARQNLAHPPLDPTTPYGNLMEPRAFLAMCDTDRRAYVASVGLDLDPNSNSRLRQLLNKLQADDEEEELLRLLCCAPESAATRR